MDLFAGKDVLSHGLLSVLTMDQITYFMIDSGFRASCYILIKGKEHVTGTIILKGGISIGIGSHV